MVPNMGDNQIFFEPIPLLSFFTGAGFLDIGFMRAGFDIVWHNEIEPNFVECFEYGMAALANPHSTGIVENKLSIKHLGWKRIASEAFHNTPRPQVFGVIGGPPCPDFSVGGKNLGKDGDLGRLSQSYVNRILALEPTFFVFENVPGLLQTAKHRKFLIHLLLQLSGKYDLDLSLLNALEYGVPQDRQRVFIIGFRRPWIKRYLGGRGLPNSITWFQNVKLEDACKFAERLEGWPAWFDWTKHRRFPNAKTKYTWPVTNPFRSNPPEPQNIPKQLMVGTHIYDYNSLGQLENDQDRFIPYSKRFLQVEEGDVSRKSFKRLHRFRYSPAAAYGNNEVHLHPSEPRRLSVREALSLQTVPSEYTFPSEVPLTYKFKTVSNGVPVDLAYAVAESCDTLFRNARV